MLFDLLNMAQRQKQANNSGRSQETSRHLTEMKYWGASRARNTISSGVSMLAGLIEAKSDYGEIPRIDGSAALMDSDTYLTDDIDIMQDETVLDRKLAADDVLYGKKSRENVTTYYKFYEEKSIQPDNNFVVEFGSGDPPPMTIDPDTGEETPREGSEERDNQDAIYGLMPKIEKWHIKSVSVDILPTDIKVEKAFNFAFPSIDIKDLNHKLSITMQEDKLGTVFNFIQWAYSKIIDKSGVHYSQANNRIGWCRVSVMNPYTLITTVFLYQDLFITGAGQLSLDYSSDGIVEYNLEFQAATRLVKTIPIRRKTSTDYDIDKFNGQILKTGLFEVTQL